MRTNCPVCGSNKRFSDWELNYKIPDGWTVPEKNDVCLCMACGMVWYDNNGTQADYDEYYKTKYGYGLDAPLHKVRLDGMAADVLKAFPLTYKIADFGGGEGYLVNKLRSFGYDVYSWDAGDGVPKDIDLIIASHVIEHVSDLKSMMESFVDALNPTTAFVIVELPDAISYSGLSWPPMLDYQTKHINHFPPFCLDLLFANHGFTCCHRSDEVSMPPYTNYRAVYKRDLLCGHYFTAKAHIEKSMAARIETMKKITEPVIMYGAADTAWYLMDKVPDLPVAYFIDEDTKSYPPGSTLCGIPVVDKVTTDHPILVIAAGQRKEILAKIRALGLNNEVIEA